MTEQTNGSTLFAQASRVFDGWTDAETGTRVLRVHPPERALVPGLYATPYHQTQPFYQGGRQMVLRVSRTQRPVHDTDDAILLDLTTGEVLPILPPGRVADIAEQTGYAFMHTQDADGAEAFIYDVRAGTKLASLHTEGWRYGGTSMLSDGRRAVVSHFQGKPYDEYCRTHFHLLSPDEEPRVFLELEGIYGNHMQGCPTDPDLFAYNAWPTPRWDIPGVTSLARVDGTNYGYVPLNDAAPRPGDFWGVRDHYVWTPDGTRIVSYLNHTPVDLRKPFNHFEFDWWLSALDWRTGEDYAAPYPPNRWGGHMHMTPDSRYILNGGGPGFDYLYAVDLAALRDRWNEHIICRYPTTVSQGLNSDPFPYPFALPDGSGVIFNAGWPGEAHGVYLAEWPASLGCIVPPGDAQ